MNDEHDEKHATPSKSRDLAIKSMRDRNLSRTPALYRALFSRIYAGEASPRQRIKGFCLECIGFERKAITECHSCACPLWDIRPYQKEAEADTE